MADSVIPSKKIKKKTPKGKVGLAGDSLNEKKLMLKN